MRRLANTLTLGCALVLTACEFSGPLEDVGNVTPLVSVDSVRTMVSGVVLDASTGDPISGAAQVSFAGEVGHLVMDLFGAPVEGWIESQGFASYGIANSVRPRSDRPVELRVIARAEGYRTNSTRVEMRRDGRHEFRLALVREDFAAEAARGSAEFEIRSDSTVAQTIVTATSLGREVLRVRIPPNTAVASGPDGSPDRGVSGARMLNATWRPPSARSLSLFPGGTDAGVRPRDGPDMPGTLTTGAVVSIEVPGAAPLLFGDSLEVISVISPALKSPRTNAAILPGDVVDILRWKPEEGIWLEQSQARVHRVGGDLTATFRSARTGTFSVGFWNGHCSDARVTLSGNTLGGSVVAWHGTPGQSDALRAWRFGPAQDEVVLEGPPGFWRGTLEVHHGQAVAQVDFASLCGAQWDISLGNAAPQDLIEVTAAPFGCSSFGVTDVPTLSVLAIPRPSPLSGEGALLRPPYIVKRLALAHESPGRVTGFSFGPVGSDDTLYLVLGGRHWVYAPSESGVLDVSNMARETGLCT